MGRTFTDGVPGRARIEGAGERVVEDVPVQVHIGLTLEDRPPGVTFDVDEVGP
jgi:hypothetical protein